MKIYYFLAGIIFIEVVIPILDEVLSVVISWLETKKAKYADMINLINMKIKQDTDSEFPEPPSVTGFGSCLTEKEDNDDIQIL